LDIKNAAAAGSPPIAGANVVGVSGREMLQPPGLTRKSFFSSQASGEDIDRFADALHRAQNTTVEGETRPLAGGSQTPVQDLVKQTMQDVAETQGMTPGKWGETLFGRRGDPNSAMKRANAIASVKQVALEHGMTEAEALEAAHGAANWADMMQVVEQGQARLPQSVDISKVLQAASVGKVSNLLKTITPSMEGVRTWTFANKLDAATERRLLRQMNEVLTSPEGLTHLRQMANWDWHAALTKAGIKLGLGTYSDSQKF
jgi:hypothetical protein